MPDDGPMEGEAKMVTMDDINSLRSSMEAQMESMRKMISEISTPPRPVSTIASPRGTSGGESYN